MKPGSNDPCPCGSGEIFERCCQEWYESAKSKPSAKKAAPPAAECHQLITLFNAGQLMELGNLAHLMLERYPDSGLVWNLLGVSLRMQGKDGLPALKNAAKFSPLDADAHGNLGNALYDLGRLEEAEACHRRGLQLNRQSANAHNNLGITLKGLGRLGEAEACFRQAIQIKPDFTEAHNNLGIVLAEAKRYKEAATCFKKVLMSMPDHADTYQNLAGALFEASLHEEAAACFKKLLSIKPDYIFAVGSYLDSKMHCCDWEGIENDFHELLAGVEAGKEVSSPFFLLAIPSTPAQQKRCAEIYVRKLYPEAAPDTKTSHRHSHNKIRLAYVSADFREHPVGELIAGVFEQHDKSRFETIAISLCLDDQSQLRKRIVKAFDKFVDASQMKTAQIAELMRDLEIDIAVDLNGHTSGSRTGIFALRPAPVQVNYLGYTGTMGAGYMDYIMADRLVIPESSRVFYNEKVVYLPNSFQANDSNKHISKHKITRSKVGLPETGFVFCCFNSCHKITPTVFDIWMQLLKQVEGSVLWLLESNAQTERNLRNEASSRGISPERIVFAKRMALPDHLARHRLADLFLDTFFYNAATTASDALRVGLPLLTCLGDTFAGRVAASLLNSIGLSELITRSHGEYKTLALELATNPGKLALIRQKLEKNRITHSLFNTALITGHIEDAYTQMWQRHQDALLPDHLYVNDIG